MKDLKFFEIIKQNKILEKELEAPFYNIAVLSNIVMNQLKDVIEYKFRTDGVNAKVRIGEYDNILQDSIKYSDSNLLLVFWEMSNFNEGIYYNIESYDKEKLAEFIEAKKVEIDLLINNLTKSPLVLFNKFDSTPFANSDIGYSNFEFVMNELNSHLEKSITKNIKLININSIYNNISLSNSIDIRNYYTSKILYSIQFLKDYTNLIAPFIMSANGKAKKALIFDCDNTLWKGVLGEDGFDKIEMSINSKNGIYFNQVQKLAMNLIEKGVIIGLCSKNNESDVQNVIENHADFIIKDKSILIKKVNWLDKVTNLQNISKELNIGLDSIVFIDDSSFEVNHVKSQLPQVEVIQVPEKLFEYPALVNKVSNLFFNLSYTKEDTLRNSMYSDNLKRKSHQKKYKNIDAYLASLGLVIEVSKDDQQNISRISQMTQKTNQFNLTTKRYTENDVKQFLESNEHIVYSFSVSDKFGGNGITALSIINIEDEAAIIDTFLMSCRIIGRNIEFSIMNFIISELKLLKIKTLRSSYIESTKNIQVKRFYDDCSFQNIPVSKTHSDYELNILGFEPIEINYIKLLYNGN